MFDTLVRSPALLHELVGPLPAGSRVLDCGCGDGSFDYALAPQLTIAALDEFVVPSRRILPHVHYAQGRAEALPYADGIFDLVIANFVMEHVANFAQAISEVARVLREGGQFSMTVPNAESFEDALYRGLYAGGGHLQRHTFESVIATVYRTTPLKLTAYADWPAGFTFLGDHGASRSLVETVVGACREALGVDIRVRSNYLFVFRRERGIGWRTIAVCGYCGSGITDDVDTGGPWVCPHCGKVNGNRAPIATLVSGAAGRATDHPGATLTAVLDDARADSAVHTVGIAWDTGDDTVGEVTVEAEGGAARLFARGMRGAETATWIQPGVAYILRLYRGAPRREELRSVTFRVLAP